MRNKNKTKDRREGRQRPGRAKPVLLTLLCAFCIVAILLAPGMIMRLRDAQLLESFYAVELSDGSLANPQLAENVGAVNAAAMWAERSKAWRTYMPGDEGWEDARLYVEEELTAEMEKLYQLGLIPTACLEAVYRGQHILEAVEYARGTVSGYELEVYRVEAYEDYSSTASWYYFMDVILYQGRVLMLSMWVNEWDAEIEWDAERIEEEELGINSASAIEAESKRQQRMEHTRRCMERYIAYLGLDVLEDWQIIQDEYSATSTSNYSMLSLIYEAEDNDMGSARVYFTPRY